MARMMLTISLFITFTVLLLGYISLNRKQEILSLLFSCAVFVVASLFAIQRSEIRTMFWFLAIFPGSMVIAFLIVSRRAGRSFVKVAEVNQNTKRWLLIFMIPQLFYLYLSSIPSRQPYSMAAANQFNPYNMEFFLDRLPFWILNTVILIYLLLYVFSKAEIHEKGIVQLSGFMDWKEMDSYSWYELDGQLRLRIMIRHLLGSKTSPVIYLVPQKAKQLIDNLLLDQLKKIS